VKLATTRDTLETKRKKGEKSAQPRLSSQDEVQRKKREGAPRNLIVMFWRQIALCGTAEGGKRRKQEEGSPILYLNQKGRKKGRGGGNPSLHNMPQPGRKEGVKEPIKKKGRGAQVSWPTILWPSLREKKRRTRAYFWRPGGREKERKGGNRIRLHPVAFAVLEIQRRKKGSEEPSPMGKKRKKGSASNSAALPCSAIV